VLLELRQAIAVDHRAVQAGASQARDVQDVADDGDSAAGG
jgi:hypothetical protein